MAVRSFGSGLPHGRTTDPYPARSAGNRGFVRLRPMTSPGSASPAPVVAVVGPTAAGKSELSLDLAEALGGEIVNTDAMQVYRGMDIGTAKVPAAARRGIPHHPLDLLDIAEPASVADFQALAREEIATLR